MLADKDIDATIAHLRSRVDHWLCVDLPGPRGTSAADLAARLTKAGIVPGEGIDAERTISCFASPREGLVAARGRAGENDRIVVFGSFLTVADVLAARGVRAP
jgi:dihydrofolate synthase/folylpolyglutamate synthase